MNHNDNLYNDLYYFPKHLSNNPLNLVQLWKYSNTHIIHVINNLNIDKLNNVWITALNTTVSLKAMIIDYLCHFKLLLSEIDDLINYE